MIVQAQSNPCTSEVFHYPVPLHGVNKPQQIFIFLSLRSTSFIPSNSPHLILYNYIHSFIGPEVIVETDNMMFDKEKACETTQEILKKHFAKLGTLLHHELLQKVTQRMFAAGLVS